MKDVLGQAQKRAEDLKKLFDKVIPLDEDSRLDRYLKLARTLGKGCEVESLMVGLMNDIQLLVSRLGLGDEISQQIEELSKAIKELSDIEPSIADSEFRQGTFSNNNYGSGAQTNNNVSGNDNINNFGGGTQRNYLAEKMNFGKDH
ncbi:hypothetical protein MCOR25_011089 [Pyricularia grisea]|nr:hypothetical protein MCOR25_011089 [Pyricularia grisea]